MSPSEYICSCPTAYFDRYCEQGNKNQPLFSNAVVVADPGIPTRGATQNDIWLIFHKQIAKIIAGCL